MLLVGIAHALETMNMLNADMEDNAEREGTILINEDDAEDPLFPMEITNNQKKFKVAYHLAISMFLSIHHRIHIAEGSFIIFYFSVMVFFLYSSLVGTTIYLIFCIGLFYGAAKKKKEYILPWIMYAIFSVLMLIGALLVGDNSDTLTRICGGHSLYSKIPYEINIKNTILSQSTIFTGFGSFLLVMGHLYCIITVVSYIYELNQMDTNRKRSESMLQSNIDISDKHVLITKNSIKIPYNDYSANAMNAEAYHV